MLKIIKLTYGTHGDTKEYSYVVDGDVRVGQIVQPTVKHYLSHKLFSTTGVVQSTNNIHGTKGRAEVDRIEKLSASRVASGEDPVTIQNLYTAKGAGVKRTRTTGGQYTGAGYHTHKNPETGKYQLPDNEHLVEDAYIKAVRKFNLDRRREQDEPPSAEVYESSSDYWKREVGEKKDE